MPADWPSGYPQETVTYNTPPSSDPNRDKAAVVAKECVAAFARPTLSHDRWWAELKPYLTQQAQIDYADTDPANLVAATVTGKTTRLPIDSTYLARVNVMTNRGEYRVVLSREDDATGWKVARITPPDLKAG